MRSLSQKSLLLGYRNNTLERTMISLVSMIKESLHNKRRDIYCWVKLKELYFQKMRTFDEKALRQRINLIVKLNNLSDLTADEKKEIMDYANRHGITTILGFLK